MTRKLTILAMVFILMISVFTGCSTTKQQEEITKEDKYVPIEVDKAAIKTISNEVTLSGKVYPDKDVMVVPKIIGKVSNINVKVGDKVRKGDILFTLDKSDIQKQVDQAKTALDGASANYQLTKEKIDNAKISLERTKQLFEQGAVSKSQLEQVELAASDSSLEAAKTGLNQAQVAYNQATDALKNAEVQSPLDGIVSVVNIETGEYATTAQPAVIIVNTDRLYIQIDVTENIINELSNGMKVKVSIPSAVSEDITGIIETISPTPDARTQLYPVKIYIENEGQSIKTGMFSQIKLNTNIRENVLTVKSEAVLEENGESVVYVLNNDIAVQRKVLTGLDTGESIEIIEGLKVDEKIIVKGQNYVENGSKVKVVRGEQ